MFVNKKLCLKFKIFVCIFGKNEDMCPKNLTAKFSIMQSVFC